VHHALKAGALLGGLLWANSVHAQGTLLPTMNGIHVTTKPIDAGTINNSGTQPVQINIAPITGTWPGEATSSAPMRVQCYNDTALAPSGGGIIGCADIFYTYGYAGAGGTRVGLNVGSLLTGSGTADDGFHMALQARATADATMGGSHYPDRASGTVDGMSMYAIATGNSGYMTNVSGLGEINWEVMYGGASILSNGGQFTRLATDWGTVISQSGNDFQGRYGLWIDSQGPGLDTTSAASMTASSGKNLPGFRSQIAMGGGGQETTFDPNNGAFLFSFPQIYANSNGCTSGVSNCPATIGPAMIKPQISWDWFEMGNIHINNETMRAPGFVVKGTGETDVGNLSITPTIAGATIAVAGSYVTAASYSGGDLSNQFQVGELLYGSYTNGTVPGAILKVTAVNGSTTTGVMGTPTALQVLDAGYSKATAATNNASTSLGTAAKFMGHGTNTVTLTWTDAVDGGAGHAGLSLVPTSGRVTIGSGANLISLDNGGMAASNNIASGASAGFVAGPPGYQLTDGSGGYGSIYESGGLMVFNASTGQQAARFDMKSSTPGFTLLNTTSIGARVDPTTTLVAPTTGTTVVLPQNRYTTLLGPAGTLASLTVELPDCNATYQGQEVRFSTTAAITSLSITYSSGGFPGGYPSSAAAGQGFGFICNPSNNGWYRLY
jgi:hypothetical protein